MVKYSKAITFATIMVGALGLAGCKVNPKEARYYPKIAGNTYELQNELGIVLPEAERINISYEFTQSEDGDSYIDAPGMFSGPVWKNALRKCRNSSLPFIY